MSEQAVATARRLTDLFSVDRKKIQGAGRAARSSLSAFNVHHYLQGKPIARISDIAIATGLSLPTVSSALSRLEKLQIVEELTGYKRNRVFAYRGYLTILEEGTEPL